MEKASFVGGVWMSSSTSEVYFSVEKDAAFHLKRFDTEEEPKFILEVFKEKGHPNFAQVSPIFQVEDGQYYYLAFKKHGVSLQDFLKDDENKKRFSNKHLISSFYQKLLVDLLRVWRHLVGLRVKCDLKLKNVYIYDDGDDPHVSLVDFSTGGASCNKWDELVALVEEINTNCRYAYGNREMQLFLRIIKDGYKNEMENLSNNSLFWSLKQRRSLTCDLWDLVKNDERFEIYEDEQIFSLNPTRWRQVFEQDTKLKELVDYVEGLNTGGGSSSNFAARNPKDFATRCCWKVIRKTCVHFESINRKVTYNIRNNGPTKNLLQRGQKAFVSVEEFQLLIESSFPHYIPALRKKALLLQRRTGLKIVPENPILKNLFTERN